MGWKGREAAKSLIIVLTAKIPRVFLLYFLQDTEHFTVKYLTVLEVASW